MASTTPAPLTAPTKKIMEQSLGLTAAQELASRLDTIGVSSDVSIGTLTTTGDVTVGKSVSVSASGVVKVGGIKVVGVQQPRIASMTLGATAGTIPTANGTTRFADAANPTVQELEDAVVELKAKQDAIIAAMVAHGLIAP